MGRKSSEKSNKKRQNGALKQQEKEMYAECEKLFQASSISLNKNQLWENYQEISTILEKIKKLEECKSDSSDVPEREDVIEEFVDWLHKNEVNTDGVSIHKFPDYGLGLKANSDLNENDLILKIPRKLIFNVSTAAAELKDLEDDILIKHMPYVALAIALLIEKYKSTSLWKPYLNILPKNYCTVLYMSMDDMMELKESPALETALKQCRNIARQYSYFKKLFHNSKNSVSKLLADVFTYEEYRWAVSTIMTRQNVIPSENQSAMVHSLIPMWDMCNHSEGKITTNFNEISNCCECYAMKSFKTDDQIFIYYGSRTNAEFFVHSGFVYPDNANDSYELHLGIGSSDKLRSEKVELLSKIGLPVSNQFPLKPEPNLLTGALLGFLRVFNMTKDNLDFWLKSDTKLDIVKKDFSSDDVLDKSVLNFIMTRIKLLLTKYRTLEEDKIQALTASEDCRKLVLQMKFSEKKLLNRVLSSLESYSKV
ncbi:actin-histidine N-methyltransferase [Nasonia vitripennis]|uniref:protein-histidine N-methyltransferase n=1 Tax=Nasonia vitripennis TaxID=7425 RepID=A0A7M7IUH5_NASVI|nr:actin-histidine N-methyltransferase [Nasonia vitripennis]